MKFLRDTWLVLLRQLLLIRRSPAGLAIGIVQPALYILLFGPLLKAALGVSTSAEAYRILVPGLLVMLAVFGPLFCGFTLIAESRAGVLERSRITPVSRYALLLGRCLSEAVTLLLQATAVLLIGLLLGLSPSPIDLLLVYVLLGLTALLIAALSHAAALRFRTESSLGPLLNGVTQPLLLTSGILLPITAAVAPGWLLNVSRLNPAAWTVQAVRALFADGAGDPQVWRALVILIVLTAGALVMSARSFSRATT